MDRERVRAAYEYVLPKVSIQELGNGLTRAQAIDHFNYVVTRDTLIELKAGIQLAERLAQTHTGPSWARVLSCVEHLR